MPDRLKPEIVLGLLVVLAGVLAILFWLPADTGSGIVVKSRGKFSIGDAFAPTVGFSLLVFSGLLLLLESRSKPGGPAITARHAGFAMIAFAVFAISLAVMRWTGPILVTMIQGEGISYRDLRDTVPWKYLGFLAGGCLLVGGFICLASRQVRPVFFLVGLAAALVMIAIYDLPFEDLLLPPNGDV
ncbi:hypothetical protein [Microbulbifer sp. S227A]|uniref:hypothetical protein n=1 Tax=Microbulbifer sp. S227A TaxID=3415131 RepID=UPI003C7C2E58